MLPENKISVGAKIFKERLPRCFKKKLSPCLLHESLSCNCFTSVEFNFKRTLNVFNEDELYQNGFDYKIRIKMKTI